MLETLSNEEIEDIISFNRFIMSLDNEKFEVDEDCLYRIIDRMNRYNNIQDKRARIIKKATRILAGITYYQPFHEGNRRTALYTTTFYLQRNGFDLPLNSGKERTEIYDLLTLTIPKIPNDPTIFGDVEQYLIGRITELIN